jgi:hypothetical protein
MSFKQQRWFEFGEFHVDAAQGILRSGSEEISLAPKVFETLFDNVKLTHLDRAILTHPKLIVE